MVIQGVSYPSDFEAKKMMIEIGRRLDEKGYVIAGEGSLSVRVGPNAVWITAEGAEKGVLKQENFIRVDMNGKQSPGSRQTRLPEDLAAHLSVYEQNPALRGVIHAYPAGAVALAAKGQEAPAADFTPSVRALGRISLAAPGDAQGNAQAAALVCRTDSGMMLPKDGCFMWGESIREAFYRIEALEYYVKASRLMRGGCKNCRENGMSAGCRDGQRNGVAAGCGDGQRTGMTAGCGDDQRNGMSAGCVQPAPGFAAGVQTPMTGGFGSAGNWQAVPVLEGLTPMVQPGEPFPGPAAEDAAAAALEQGMPQSPGNAKPAGFPSASGPASAPESGVRTVSRRAQMMEEVVRRSLASI